MAEPWQYKLVLLAQEPAKLLHPGKMNEQILSDKGESWEMQQEGGGIRKVGSKLHRGPHLNSTTKLPKGPWDCLHKSLLQRLCWMQSLPNLA